MNVTSTLFIIKPDSSRCTGRIPLKGSETDILILSVGTVVRLRDVTKELTTSFLTIPSFQLHLREL